MRGQLETLLRSRLGKKTRLFLNPAARTGRFAQAALAARREGARRLPAPQDTAVPEPPPPPRSARPAAPPSALTPQPSRSRLRHARGRPGRARPPGAAPAAAQRRANYNSQRAPRWGRGGTGGGRARGTLGNVVRRERGWEAGGRKRPEEEEGRREEEEEEGGRRWGRAGLEAKSREEEQEQKAQPLHGGCGCALTAFLSLLGVFWEGVVLFDFFSFFFLWFSLGLFFCFLVFFLCVWVFLCGFFLLV